MFIFASGRQFQRCRAIELALHETLAKDLVALRIRSIAKLIEDRKVWFIASY